MIRDIKSVKSRTARLLKSIINKRVSRLFINVLIEAEEAITL